jgi:peptide/nickel transport system permease protein
MTRFLARRLVQYVATLLVGSFLLFVATEFSPGTVSSKILGPYAVKSQVDLLSERLRLNDPLPQRYGRWLATLTGLGDNPMADPAIGLGLADPRGPRYAGNLGFSLMLKQPVVDALDARIGYTILLTLCSIALIVPIAFGVGVWCGLTAGSLADRVLSTLMAVLTALPEFAFAVALTLLFVIGLGWLPGTSTMMPGDRWSAASQLVLPTTVLVVASATYVARIVRASVVDTAQRPFVRAAELKGLPRREIVTHHILRNALIAPVTVILLQINWLLTGVVVVESIFAYPGVGSLLLQAALFGDIYLVQALTLMALTIAVGTQFIGDLCYMVLDPRIRVA